MLFLVDESMGSKFTALLKNAGHDTVFAGYAIPKVADKDVLVFAAQEKRVLITADKDFGKLAVHLKIPVRGIILFRTLTRQPDKRFELVRGILDKAEGRFIVVKEGQIRVRRLK